MTAKRTVVCATRDDGAVVTIEHVKRIVYWHLKELKV